MITDIKKRSHRLDAGVLYFLSDFDIDQKEGTINSMIVSLKKGVFSKEELEVPFEDIETIGGYVILAKELPKPEEAEEEVEAQKVEVEKEE